MSAAQRISRGFHRGALFLAAIPLLLGGSLSVYIAFDLANRLWEQHQKLVCAHEHVAGQKPDENVFDQFDTVKLKQIGCSNSDDTVTVGEARNPPPNLNWFAAFGSGCSPTPDARRYPRRLRHRSCDRLGHWRLCGFMSS